MPSKARAKRWPEKLKGKLICIRVTREVKAAFYAQARAKGLKPCTVAAEWVTRYSGVKA